MAREQRILVGQVVAITGGARGIGKATAQRLAREGMKVSIGDLDSDLAAEVAGQIGGGAIGMELDVTDVESFSDFIEATEAMFTRWPRRRETIFGSTSLEP